MTRPYVLHHLHPLHGTYLSLACMYKTRCLPACHECALVTPDLFQAPLQSYIHLAMGMRRALEPLKSFACRCSFCPLSIPCRCRLTLRSTGARTTAGIIGLSLLHRLSSRRVSARRWQILSLSFFLVVAVFIVVRGLSLSPKPWCIPSPPPKASPSAADILPPRPSCPASAPQPAPIRTFTAARVPETGADWHLG